MAPSTLPDSDRADTLPLEEALEILAAKTGKPTGGKPKRAAKTPVKTAAKTADVPSARTAAKKPAARKPAAKKPAAKKPAAKKT